MFRDLIENATIQTMYVAQMNPHYYSGCESWEEWCIYGVGSSQSEAIEDALQKYKVTGFTPGETITIFVAENVIRWKDKWYVPTDLRGHRELVEEWSYKGRRVGNVDLKTIPLFIHINKEKEQAAIAAKEKADREQEERNRLNELSTLAKLKAKYEGVSQ